LRIRGRYIPGSSRCKPIWGASQHRGAVT
jgi:hypothetical protein